MNFFKKFFSDKKQVAYVDVNAGYMSRTWGTNIRMDFRMLHYLYKNIAEIQAGKRRIANAMIRDGFIDSVEFYRNFTKVDSPLAGELLNLIQNMESFKHRFVRDAVVYGNIYINKVKNPFGKVIQLQFVDPRTMYVVSDETGEIIKYIQRVAGYPDIEFDKENIIHLVLDESLENPLLGMSPLEALLYDGYAEVQSAKTNKAFYENAGTPSHLLIIKKPISQDQATEIKDSMREHFGGSDNKYKSGIIPFVEDIKTVAPTQKEMEYLATRVFNARKISIAMGVDMFLLGHTEGVQRSNGDTIERDFYENTVRAYENLFTEFLQNLINELDSTLQVYIKKTDHYNLLINKTQAREDFKAGIITMNEARQISGLAPSDNELADEHFINGFMVDDLAEELKKIRQEIEIKHLNEKKECKNLLDI